ncbi:MAG: acyl-[acyl-carrier-protein] thioesterase [Streptococcaceae bacterium]|nr:acyl-[acyl-carrier-protein] thioesterase [Streptococcaceae bacterium]
MGVRFEKDYVVTYYDSDAFGEMKLSNLLSVSIYISGIQSKLLGRSDEYLHERGLTWILTAHEVQVERMPKNEEKITIQTEAKRYNKYFCYRDFLVLSSEGEELVRVTSTFAMMDIRQRRIATIQEDILTPYESEKERKIQRPKAVELMEPSLFQKFHTKFSELDLNQHINNAKYIDYLLDPLGFEFLKEHRLKTLFIRYVLEIKADEQVESVIEKSELLTKHQLKIGDTLHTEALIEWRKHEI